MSNIHSLFVNENNNDIIEDLKDIQSQYNENVIEINKEFATHEQFHDQSKLAIQSAEKDIIKFGKKLRKLKTSFDAQDELISKLNSEIQKIKDESLEDYNAHGNLIKEIDVKIARIFGMLIDLNVYHPK